MKSKILSKYVLVCGVISLLIIFFRVPHADAISCSNHVPNELSERIAYFKEYDAIIFIGKPVDLFLVDGDRTSEYISSNVRQYEVESVINGSPAPIFHVSDIGYASFEEGVSYLIFASRSDPWRFWTTSLCNMNIREPIVGGYQLPEMYPPDVNGVTGLEKIENDDVEIATRKLLAEKESEIVAIESLIVAHERVIEETRQAEIQADRRIKTRIIFATMITGFIVGGIFMLRSGENGGRELEP